MVKTICTFFKRWSQCGLIIIILVTLPSWSLSRVLWLWAWRGLGPPSGSSHRTLTRPCLDQITAQPGQSEASVGRSDQWEARSEPGPASRHKLNYVSRPSHQRSHNIWILIKLWIICQENTKFVDVENDAKLFTYLNIIKVWTSSNN